MPEQFSTNKARIQFLYPFKVDRWESFRNGINAFLDEQKDDLFSELFEVKDRLLTAFSSNINLSHKIEEILGSCLNRYMHHPNNRKSNASMIAEIQALVGKLPIDAHGSYQFGQNLCHIELAELIQKHEAKFPENLMEFVCQKINASQIPLLREAEYHPGDDRGTRGYLERKRPYVDTKLKAQNVAIANPQTLPDIIKKLSHHSSFRGKRVIRLASSLRLMSNGYGCLRLKVHLVNKEGLFELVDEIVFATEGYQGKSTPLILKKRVLLAKKLEELIVEAIRRRSISTMEVVLQEYSTHLNTKSIKERLQTIVDEITLVQGELSTNDIIDIENLDRGLARGQEPLLIWEESDGETYLCKYFEHIIQNVFLKNLKEVLAQDRNILQFINRPEQRQTSERKNGTSKEQLISSLLNLAFQNPSLTIEEHPYITTFLSAPAFFKKPEARETKELVEHFRAMIKKHREDLARIQMKSKWAEIRSNWRPAISVLENVFYSDLIHMSVHGRSTLYLAYTLSNADEYRLIPDLASAYKYRQELNDTLQAQRILWYAYVTSDDLVTQDIRNISAALETLKERSLKEEFPEVIEGLADITRGIDHRKVALAEIMEDPSSRKGGSSLFSELIEKTNRAFYLKILYENLHNKVERLDMLGMHVVENVQEYSSLLVQEGTRSAQLTLEFLEAIIVAFYITELTHISFGEEKRGIPPFEEQSWAYFVVAIGVFLTALPLITSIRRGRSKLYFENPQWLERLENFGKIAGPALLFVVTYLTIDPKGPTRRWIIVIFVSIIFLGWLEILTKWFEKFLAWIKNQ
ncbi:MAG: hypothetical protein HY776_02430 [Actinobacteria bacterium]|nr:hypothetical protein [Actinomycetota bacterium]